MNWYGFAVQHVDTHTRVYQTVQCTCKCLVVFIAYQSDLLIRDPEFITQKGDIFVYYFIIAELWRVLPRCWYII